MEALPAPSQTNTPERPIERVSDDYLLLPTLVATASVTVVTTIFSIWAMNLFLADNLLRIFSRPIGD